MGRTSAIAEMILAKRAEQERRAAAELARRLTEGPPAGSRVSAEAWSSWQRYGFVSCPGEKQDLTCQKAECAIGATCQVMAAKGLYGDGAAMTRKDRPACGAKTRAGGACAMKVEPGKRRCRLHGGLSTGPKTAEGKARISEGQMRRWYGPRHLRKQPETMAVKEA